MGWEKGKKKKISRGEGREREKGEVFQTKPLWGKTGKSSVHTHEKEGGSLETMVRCRK